MLRPAISLLLVSALSTASVARAQNDGPDACLSSYDSSQRHRRAGELLKARDALLICAQSSCPSAVAKECTLWLREVNEALPSVVFAARDSRGNDVSEVRVLDGDRVVSERIDGREILLDPGPHKFVFEFADGNKVVRRLVVRQAEKNRLVDVRLAPAAGSATSTPARPNGEKTRPAPARGGPPVLAIVLGSVGALALGSFAWFALDAKSDIDDMESRCAPECDQSEVDAAERKALIADVSLGVGVVALGAAGFVWLNDRGRPEPRPSAPSAFRPLGLGFSGRF